MLEGEINQINLIDRLVEMWREQFTGAIRFESDGIIKIVYFKGGDILSASTNDRADSIDEILMRAGKVSREHVKQALAKRKENETLGDALLNLGFITRKELSWARRVQVVGVIRSIAAWTAGSFTIVADYLPKRDEGTQFPVPQIVVELIVTEGDRQKFEKALDGGSLVFSKAPDFEDIFRRLGLNEEAEQISREIDGDKSAADVAAASGKDTFNVYKLLHALATLRILTPAQISPRVTDVTIDDFVTAGVSDAADMWEPTPEPEAEVPVEPVIQAQPMFELDEAEAIHAPTLEVPMSYDAPPPAAPATSAWDDDDEPATAQAWSEPPVETSEPMLAETEEAPIPTLTPAEARAVAADGQWGFDEAQLEAARRVSVPVPVSAKTTDAPAAFARKQKPKSRSSFGLVIALMVVFILAAAGYFGFMAWTKKQAEPTPLIVQPRQPQPRPAVAAQTGTVVPTATETTSGAVPASGAGMTTTAEAAVAPQVTATNTIAATTTVAPAPPVAAAPMIIAPSRVPAGGRDRYDAMARDFLANASGNFTVQIQILCEASNLDKVLKAGGADVWFVPQPIGARSCYRVLWGRFATREEAQRAMAQVPAALRDPAAAVKPVPKG